MRSNGTGNPQRTERRPYALGTLLLLIGGWLLWQGSILLSLDGSPYYVAAGALTMISGLLALMRRRAGAQLYAAMLAASVVWAIWEAGFDGWALAARLVAPMILGLWFLLPATRRKLTGKFWSRGLTAGLAVGSVAAGAMLHLTMATRPVDPVYQTGAPGGPLRPVADGAVSADEGDWRHYGRDEGGTRYSRLDQITPRNVDRLDVAWTYRFGPGPEGAPRSLQTTPLKIGDTLYACSAYNDIVALDAETGRQKWRFRSETDVRGTAHGACRGVGYYEVPGRNGLCASRVYTNTIDARLIAVDARDGRPCADFGDKGIVDLRAGMGDVPKGYYYVSSAPTVARGRIVLGGWVFDNMYWGEPSGVIRAFDAVTGKLSWAFDVGRLDRRGEPPEGETYTHSTPNSWAPMSVDPDLGLVYAPLGGAALDYAGAHRRPFDDEWAGTVVAIDVETGAPRWKFRTVYHDLWDYDVPAQPTLVDWPTTGGMRKALVQATKRGEIFVLDRVTGKPIFPVTLHKAPTKGALPDERVSPVQPFSDAMPSFRGPLLEERQMWGLTPLDQLACRILFRKARYDGPLTPPGLTPNIVSPGFLGGSDWGGVSIDTDRQVMIVNSNHMANFIRLIPRGVADAMGIKPFDADKPVTAHGGSGIVALKGTPVAAELAPFLSPIFAPCQQPPWGHVTAVDLVTRRVLWRHSLGTARDSGPMGLASQLPFRMGVPNMGGAMTTRGGLVFLAATQDRYLRAFDEATGKVLWRARLPAGGQATPMTYISSQSGRQFVTIAAGGHPMMNTKAGDYIIAYALPKE